MKTDVTRVLVNIYGEKMNAGVKDGRTIQATLRWACVESLMAMFEDEKNLSGDEKLKRYRLASKIQKQDKPDLSSEDRTLIKQLIAKNFGPAVVGPAYEMLENEPLSIVKEEPEAEVQA